MALSLTYSDAGAPEAPQGELSRRKYIYNRLAEGVVVPKALFYRDGEEFTNVWSLLDKFVSDDESQPYDVLQLQKNLTIAIWNCEFIVKGPTNIDLGIHGPPDDPWKCLICYVIDSVNRRTGNINNVVKTGVDEVVNGYKLYDYEGVPFTADLCEEFMAMWNAEAELDKAVPFSEFEDLVQEERCCEWNKMDRFGNRPCEYSRSDDARVRDKAFTLSGVTNVWYLYRLPFPKKLIVRLVGIGCRLRLESVRHVNAFAVMFQRYADVANLGLKEYNPIPDPECPENVVVVQQSVLNCS